MSNKKNLTKLIFSHKTLGAIFVLAQLVFFAASAVWLQDYSKYLYGASTIAAIIAIIYELNREVNNSFKISWLIIFAIVPVMGILLCFFMHFSSFPRKVRRRIKASECKTEKYLHQDLSTFNEIKEQQKDLQAISHYLYKTTGFPTYKNSAVKYMPTGEAFYSELTDRLKSAKKFIFMEFFIIAEGKFWSEVLEILKDKAKSGVDVRIMFDGMGCLTHFNRSYPDFLKQFGIKCRIFAPVVPFLSSYQNNRDHRKIVVVDGKYAFTGGVNIADEYINEIKRFGHWKDNAILITGEAVCGFTAMFLQMWDLVPHGKEDFDKFFPPPNNANGESKGYVIPYCDNPVDNETVGRNVYLSIINTAVEYVHIMTPYLILDNEVLDALKFAARRGIDVKIMMPGIPDKWYAFILAKTFYPELIRAGVKIYEYTPGFVHSKTMVSDDIKAVVGTINQDFRSMYLHFECAAFLYNVPQIKDISNDFEETLKKCTKMFMENYKELPFFSRAVGRLLRIFAPLM